MRLTEGKIITNVKPPSKTPRPKIGWCGTNSKFKPKMKLFKKKDKTYTEKEVKLIANEAYLQGAKDFNQYKKDNKINTFHVFWKNQNKEDE